jgi:anion-transporting  ArsA/GET3 family ATPase
MFTGKGGVGKTTVVASLALALAEAGRRPLIVEMGHRASMEAVFDAGEIHYEPRQIGPGVWAMNLDFESGLYEYMLEHVRVRRVVKAIMKSKPLQRFFHAAPSVSEVAILNKLANLEAEQDEQGRPRWDPILVDLDATGHAIMLLNLPSVLDGLIGDGPMRALVDGFSELLSDPKRSVLHLVTLPRELPAQETAQLFNRLSRHHDVPLGVLFVNKVPRAPLPARGASILRALERRARTANREDALEAVTVARRAQTRHAGARSMITKLLQAVALPLVEVAHVPGRVELQRLTELGRSMLTAEPVEPTPSRPRPSLTGDPV